MSEAVELITINRTDLLIARRLIAATRDINRYSDTNVAEAKLLADILGESLGAASTASEIAPAEMVPAMAEAA